MCIDFRNVVQVFFIIIIWQTLNEKIHKLYLCFFFSLFSC